MKTIKNIVYASIILLLTACGKGNGGYDASGVFETTEVIVSAEANGKIMQLNFIEGQQVEQGKSYRIYRHRAIISKKDAASHQYKCSKERACRYTKTDSCDKATNCNPEKRAETIHELGKGKRCKPKTIG
jgi:hypothetical protein